MRDDRLMQLRQELQAPVFFEPAMHCLANMLVCQSCFAVIHDTERHARFHEVVIELIDEVKSLREDIYPGALRSGGRI